ncbi:MAG TPA: hypothetical protein VIK64_02240 [Anaerolineales bacterium]
MTTAFRIKLTIPCLPDLDLSANRRWSRVWQAQARDTATERERAAVMLLESAAGQYQAVRTPVILRGHTTEVGGTPTPGWTFPMSTGTPAQIATGAG